MYFRYFFTNNLLIIRYYLIFRQGLTDAYQFALFPSFRKQIIAAIINGSMVIIPVGFGPRRPLVISTLK